MNSRATRVEHKAHESLVTAWGTMYLGVQLERATAHLSPEPDGYSLCYTAPELPVGPNEGIPSSAAPAEFRFTILNLPKGSKVRFLERCRPGANNSSKPTPLRGAA
ncbi:hypothetical protein GCM10027188_28870 [Lysobacter humi (ex Lee et al. 2017)]